MGRIEFHCTVVAKAAITGVWSQPHSEKNWMLDLVDLVDPRGPRHIMVCMYRVEGGWNSPTCRYSPLRLINLISACFWATPLSAFCTRRACLRKAMETDHPVSACFDKSLENKLNIYKVSEEYIVNYILYYMRIKHILGRFGQYLQYMIQIL